MSPADKDPAREPEIATGTLAEIYAQQGLHERALEIYRRIADRRPGDAGIARRIAALEEAIERRDEEGAPTAPAEAGGRAPAPEPVAASAGPDGDPQEADATGPEPPGADAPDADASAPPLDRDDPFRSWLERK